MKSWNEIRKAAMAFSKRWKDADDFGRHFARLGAPCLARCGKAASALWQGRGRPCYIFPRRFAVGCKPMIGAAQGRQGIFQAAESIAQETAV